MGGPQFSWRSKSMPASRAVDKQCAPVTTRVQVCGPQRRRLHDRRSVLRPARRHLRRGGQRQVLPGARHRLRVAHGLLRHRHMPGRNVCCVRVQGRACHDGRTRQSCTQAPEPDSRLRFDSAPPEVERRAADPRMHRLPSRAGARPALVPAPMRRSAATRPRTRASWGGAARAAPSAAQPAPTTLSAAAWTGATAPLAAKREPALGLGLIVSSARLVLTIPGASLRTAAHTARSAAPLRSSQVPCPSRHLQVHRNRQHGLRPRQQAVLRQPAARPQPGSLRRRRRLLPPPRRRLHLRRPVLQQGVQRRQVRLRGGRHRHVHQRQRLL